MKSKKTISIKNKRLRNIRNSFREIIILACGEAQKELSRRKEVRIKEGALSSEIQGITDEWWRIERLKKASICKCPICNKADQDMTFNPVLKQWFCVNCFSFTKNYNILVHINISLEQIYEFLERLSGQEGCQVSITNWKCGGPEFKFSRRILNLMNIPKNIQEEFLSLCQSFGGHCDCEILMNFSSKLLGIDTPC